MEVQGIILAGSWRGFRDKEMTSHADVPSENVKRHDQNLLAEQIYSVLPQHHIHHSDWVPS